MGNGFIGKIKDWMTDEVEDDFMDEELEEMEEEVDVDEELSSNVGAIAQPKSNKIVNIHTAGQMKVVIVEPKKYEEVTSIADQLKQRRAVIVNLENLDDAVTRKSIFDFMNGAVYVLDGSIQKVSKAIFILAPNNVDIDANMKKELESKAFFPWQNK
ncbi:cell division protein SepF [Paraclostridium sordellii]|uniref:Cell division protein SepF n=1 Tax=Paraclostridium sordellii TaxID=1505 RepID=A0A0C7PCH0_PARSO|nr:cell division protein SepF [Paeniclostridium sordellii]QYE97540.1 cell division protein SepF [Paeniclostridium sordellii]CEN79820.1 cell division protein SepF [[Clostridium] sordellii] [Paeniclostridium sordellii]CEP81629.1 cell division protein SepF [[Clostridium] sordellii] [Paeniclostridium sordellii]CEQ04734.1 cell division protein SepF [[Clostridium] sordellii] [Paeniclostridium sordellii]